MRACLPLLAILLGACLDHDPAMQDLGAEGGTFIAMQRDFQGFRSWEAYELGDEAIPDGGHPAGKRRVYVNELPAPGLDRWPVGSILVKTRGDDADPTTWEVHAMVKRGGDFNAAGALGWEWFDLRLDDRGNAIILWRGLRAPAGHGYKSLFEGGGAEAGTDGDCNSCHTPGAGSDSVLTEELALEGF